MHSSTVDTIGACLPSRCCGAIWIGATRRFCYNAAIMNTYPGFNYLPALVAQAFLLMFISRSLFRGMCLAFSNRKGGGFITFIRFAGNAIHETSHAIGYLVCGYKVKHIIFCAIDPHKTGSCVRGKPWSPIAFPWLADGAAALMPLAFGTIALVYIGRLLGIAEPSSSSMTADIGMLRVIVDRFLELFTELDWHRWQTYAFLYFAFSIGAEISPSHTDMRYAFPALFTAAAAIALLLYGASYADGLNEVLLSFSTWALPIVQRLFALWGLAIVLMLLAAAVGLPVTFLVHSFRPTPG